MRPAPDSDALRVALAMIRADWQDDDESWNQLWAVADDDAAVARALTTICRESLQRLASVGGVSTGEMFHRLASTLVPTPDAGHARPQGRETAQPHRLSSDAARR